MGVPPNLSKIRGYGYANVCAVLVYQSTHAKNHIKIHSLNFRSSDVLHDAMDAYFYYKIINMYNRAN